MNLDFSRTPARLTPLVLAGVGMLALGGCASTVELRSSESAVITSSANQGDAAGIQLAQPSGAPDKAAEAKRRAPEAVGSVVDVVFGEDSVQVIFAPDAGYEYYEGTTFDIPFSAATAIDGETAVVLGDLKPGDRINVWTDSCRESSPVQCDVQAVTAAS